MIEKYNIEPKSFLLGLLLGVLILLLIGARSGGQDVRIVGIDKSAFDWDAILVESQ